MKRTLVIAVLTIASATVAFGQWSNGRDFAGAKNDAVKATIISLEKQLWEAWKTRDGKVFQAILSDDAIIVDEDGSHTKEQILGDVSTSKCELRSYSLDNFQMTMLDKDTALITYKVAQDFTCNGKIQPPVMWSSSVYARRGGKWLSAFYQEVPAASFK